MKKERQLILYLMFILVLFLTSSLLILSISSIFSLSVYASPSLSSEDSSVFADQSKEQVIFIDTDADPDAITGAATDGYTETYIESSNQIVGLIVTKSSNAYENFRATANHASFNVCTCDSFKDSLRVSNLGTVTTNYNLMKAGTASKFVNHVPAYFILDPGQSQDIEMFGSVPCSSSAVGPYELETYFKTVSGMTQVLKQPLNIKQCNSFDMHLVYPSFKNYPCTTTLYELKLYNREDFADTYKLSIPKLNPKYYTFSESYVLLAPYEERSIFIYINLPCSSSSSYNFDVKAVSMQSEQEKTKPLYLTIDKKGYNFQLELGQEKKLANLTTTDTSTIIFKSAKDNQINVCANDVYSVPVKITNFAEFTNTFYISSSDDSIKTPQVVTLNKGQSILLSNYFNAAESSPGNHTYSIKALSDKGRLTTQLAFKVSVSDCQAKQKQGTSKTAKALMLFFLLFLVLLLVLFFLWFLLISKKPSVYDELKAEEDAEEELEKKELEELEKEKFAREKPKKTAILETETNARWWIVPLIILLVLILLLAAIFLVGKCKDCHFGVPGNETQEKEAETQAGDSGTTQESVSVEPVVVSTSEDTDVQIPKETEDKEAEDIEDEEAEVETTETEASEAETTEATDSEAETAQAEEGTSFWQKVKAWFAAGPINATEISDSTQASNITELSDEKEEEQDEEDESEPEILEVVEPSAVTTNETIIPEENLDAETEGKEPSLLTNVTEPASTQEMQPVVYINYVDPRANMTQQEIDFAYQYLAEDEIKALNLSKYFIDIDGDKLVYSNNDALNVDIDYDNENGEIAYIIPHRDWTGESSVVFKAEDGKGGYAHSPEIAIVVRPQNEFVQWMKKSRLYLIIAASVIILLLLALLIYGIYKWRSPKQILLKKKAVKQ